MYKIIIAFVTVWVLLAVMQSEMKRNRSTSKKGIISTVSYETKTSSAVTSDTNMDYYSRAKRAILY
jgi:hypothetical protein